MLGHNAECVGIATGGSTNPLLQIGVRCAAVILAVMRRTHAPSDLGEKVSLSGCYVAKQRPPRSEYSEGAHTTGHSHATACFIVLTI